ncbi:MAG TPA: hypothetical protein VG899_15770 [Mycobacteriales bacterium]|nr:hypothetical protein [Mycobacteriales bacterium]
MLYETRDTADHEGEDGLVNLVELNLTTAHIDLGGIDAESDPRLEAYFVETPYVQSALQGRRTLFLGRKGSGKSALFRELPRLAAAHATDDQAVLAVRPDQYAWSALREYKEQGLLSEQAHTNAWKLTLAVEAVGAMLALDRSWLPKSQESLEILRTFVSDNFGRVQPSLLSTAASIVKGLTSFNFSAFGFGVGLSREETKQVALAPAATEALFKNLGVLVEECGLIVAIDRLDDSWDGTEESRSLLIGLLKATKEINDQNTPNARSLGIRVVVFLRSDIYDDLRFDDKDKHRRTEQTIVWNIELLKEMVDRRLPQGLTIDELFESGEMRGSISPFGYIVRRTFLRPREVLQFLDECLQEAGPSATSVTKDDVRSAEARYSRWKVADLKQEFQKVFPELDPLVECLRQERHRYDSLRDLQKVIERKAPQLVKQFGIQALLERLFEYSVIGVRIGDAGSTRFKSEDSELVLPRSGAVYVHQGLHRGLNIRETRKAATERAARLDKLTIDLFSKMQSRQPTRDLAFLELDVRPADVLRNETFDECAKALGVALLVDHGERASTLGRPNRISGRRFNYNSTTYETLRAEMVGQLEEGGVSVEEYLRADESSRLDD